MFSLIAYQEQLADRFQAIAQRASGHRRRSRGALRREALAMLVSGGYTVFQATEVIRDAQDYAELLECCND